MGIWLAYTAIPIALVYFIRRRRDTPFHWIFWMFGSFIIACGFTHLLEVVMLFDPMYRFAGLIKLITAIISIVTVVALVRLTPRALALPGMAAMNEQLRSEIVQRQEAERELEQRARELTQSNAELEQFAYIAAHDLQEPLRMVALYTELIATRYKGRLDADADAHIEFAVEGASRMKALIDDLLAFSRIGSSPRAIAPTDLTVVVTKLLDTLRPTILETRAVVRVGALPTLAADAGQMERLFQNLITNALKFRGERVPVIEIGAQQHEGGWKLWVADNGIGLDVQYSERIFAMFQRLHGRDEYPGTGVGLAIAKKIVERHGGRIWVESQPGRGATFFFTLLAYARATDTAFIKVVKPGAS